MRGFKCEKCEHTASRRSSLVQHVERVHGSREAGRSDGSGVIILHQKFLNIHKRKYYTIIYFEIII